MQTAVDLAASPNPFITKGTDFDTALACAMAASTVSSWHTVYQLQNGRWYWSRWGFYRHYNRRPRLAFFVYPHCDFDELTREDF